MLDEARRRLFESRGTRIPPGRDDKVLTSWNALMIRGMARAARLLGQPELIASAARAVDFIRASLWRNRSLLASWRDGRARFNAYLDDYAFLLDALLEMMQTRFRPEDLRFAEDLAEALLDRFEDTRDGGFFFTSHDHEALLQRPKPVHDSAMPSGNGVAAFALQRLGHMTGESRHREAAERGLRAFFAGMQSQPGGQASMVTATLSIASHNASGIASSACSTNSSKRSGVSHDSLGK